MDEPVRGDVDGWSAAEEEEGISQLFPGFRQFFK